MLLWMESFDKYGVDATRLTQGVYADADGVTLSTANPRTGAHCARISPNTGDRGLRRVFGADYQEAGVGYAFNIPILPSASGYMILAGFADNSYNVQCSLAVSATGQVVAYRGKPADEIVLGASAPIITAGSYNHFECRVFCDDVAGEMEVRINGVTVLNLAGVDNCAIPGAIMAQVKIGLFDNRHLDFPTYMDVDDLFAWSPISGTQNSDFIGDKKVYVRGPSADTAQADWTPSAGSAWSILSADPPSDAAYIEATTPGALSIFALADLPAEVVSIAAVQIAWRAWKTDAGNAKVQMGMTQGSDTDLGDETPVTLAPAYYSDVFEVDPATGAPWTVGGFASAELQIERTE